MATKETATQQEHRHIETLTRAWGEHLLTVPMAEAMAKSSYRQTEAAVRAAAEGRQTHANTAAQMDAAIKAVAKVIRTHGGEAVYHHPDPGARG